MEADPEGTWPRAIVLVDMNAFFAAIEQLDRPEWQGRPVGITNGRRGTCIITCSYEARSYGIRTGMRLREARRRCPDLIQAPARPRRYADVSARIMSALETITPDLEVFSVDEAFLDVSRCQRLFGTPETIAQRVKRTIHAVSGLPCSVGVGGDKTTAKYAAKLDKPDGLTVIPPGEAAMVLRDVPVTELCGIGPGIGRFLAERGVETCGQMARLPVGELARRFGDLGRRIWLMAQGRDPSPVRPSTAPPKSIGHGKVIPPETRDHRLLLVHLRHMSEKVAARLRRHGMVAGRFLVGIRLATGWRTEKPRCIDGTDDGRIVYGLCREVLQRQWRGEGVFQVQVTALDPRPAWQQADLFVQTDERRRCLHSAIDAINARYGEFTLMPAPLLARSDMPDVIAPSWRPGGPRDTL